MCSRNPEDDELMKPKEEINLLGAKCRKCEAVNASVVLQSKFPYCRNCFLAYLTHKFRATLGKSKIMKHGDKVLIGFSGSGPSFCLLDLVKKNSDESRRKKITTSTVLLHIDEGTVFECGVVERNEKLKEIFDSVLLYNFQTFCTTYDGFFTDDIKLFSDPTHFLEMPVSHLMTKLMNDLTSETSKLDFIVKARINILVKAARLLECNKIFLADTSDHLSINILSNISQGRGGQLALDTGFCDDRFGDVLIVRPLRDCSKKEITFYNLFNDLSPITTFGFETKKTKYSSIQQLTESFISELQSAFPSTVSTVVSTGSKLVPSRNLSPSACSLCLAKIESKDDELSTERATEISSFISQLGPKGFDSSSFVPVPQDHPEDLNCCDTKALLPGSCNCRSLDSVTKEHLSHELCYSCKLILKDCKTIENWPSSIISKVCEKRQLEVMKNEIKDFLLE